ncbi:MAG: MBL fold metallo-hydrolase [Candidatus Hydrogenedentota bacterium]|nr:MAG: MBL fold metallo-hydrolase [Candidatus Hydrogenedentota bacterium]
MTRSFRKCQIVRMTPFLLGGMHLLFPEYRWGQGRHSYFNFGRQLSLGSWVISALFAAAGLLFLAARNRAGNDACSPGDSSNSPPGSSSSVRNVLGFRSECALAAAACFLLSFSEFSRWSVRLGFFPTTLFDSWHRLDAIGLLRGPYHLLLFSAAALWILHRLASRAIAALPDRFSKHENNSLFLLLLLVLITHLYPPWIANTHLLPALIKGEILLFAAIHLVDFSLRLSRCVAVPEILLQNGSREGAEQETRESEKSSSGKGTSLLESCRPVEKPPRRILLLTGLTAFLAIDLELVLFQVLMVSADYVTATSAVAIALFGISVGAFAAAFPPKAPAGGESEQFLSAAFLLLPFFLPAALGAASAAGKYPYLAALFLLPPFLLCGFITTTFLRRFYGPRIYAADLAGAALGAALADPIVRIMQEEGAFLFLASLAAFFPLLFTRMAAASSSGEAAHGAGEDEKRFRRAYLWLSFLFLFLLGLQQRTRLLSVTRPLYAKDYPNGALVASASSLAGRIDVVWRERGSIYFKFKENGRTIDTLRILGKEAYRIDPRLPYNLIDSPSVLIIGLSGEGVTKTAVNLGGEVEGVEINEAVLRVLNGKLGRKILHVFGDIQTEMIDGRTFLDRSEKRYDFITLLNTHFARGKYSGLSPSPEYLHTVEAGKALLEHLTDRGFLSIEEPVNRPSREAPVWKMLLTLREALVRLGVSEPERHLLAFSWTTRKNRYYQILVKKSSLTEPEIARFRKWLDDVNRIKEREKAAGGTLGPIHTAVCTPLYFPGANLDNTIARVIEGRLSEATRARYNLVPATDDRPFPFFVDPSRKELREALLPVAIPAVLLIAVGIALCLRNSSRETHFSAGLLSAIALLTGLAYLLIEIALFQICERFLGSPTVSLAVVLGGMLVFSSLGSRLASHISPAILILVPPAIFLLAVGFPAYAGAVFEFFSSSPSGIRSAVNLAALAPLSFLMGIPFAAVLHAAQAREHERHTPILFAINGVTSALAVPLALNLSVMLGFRTMASAAAGFYLLVALLFFLDSRGTASMRRAGVGLGFGLPALLLLSVLLPSATTPRSGPAGGNAWRVLALKYGESRMARKNLYAGAERGRERAGWYAWLIRGTDRTILVDCGFLRRKDARRWRIRHFRRVETLLREIGVPRDAVTDLVLTHLHWDHAGAVGRFSEARVWLQRKEYEWARAGFAENERERVHGVDRKTLEVLEEIAGEGRLRLVDGETEIASGVSLIPAGGHTPGSQVVAVEADVGKVWLAGDEVMVYDNLFRNLVVGTAADSAANTRIRERMLANAAGLWFVIPGHGRKVARYFPAEKPSIYRIEADR